MIDGDAIARFDLADIFSGLDHDTALRRLEQAGAVPTTAEAVAFEWLNDSTHPQFKAVSKLVVSRELV